MSISKTSTAPVKINYKQKILEIIKQIPDGKAVSYGQVGDMIGLSGFFVGKILSSLSESECEGTNWYKVVRKDGYISTLKFGYKGVMQKELLKQAKTPLYPGVSSKNDGCDDYVDMQEANYALETLEID